MQAFDVQLNGKNLCVAGLRENGVVSLIVTWLSGERGTDCFLQVGGLISRTQQHIHWVSKEPLKPDDSIQVRVLEADTADEPKARKGEDEAKALAAKKEYVRKLVKELGWKLEEG